MRRSPPVPCLSCPVLSLLPRRIVATISRYVIVCSMFHVCLVLLRAVFDRSQEGFSLTAPLVFYYGHTNLQENPELYKVLMVRSCAR